MDGLKPCPFCGNVGENIADTGLKLVCATCGASQVEIPWTEDGPHTRRDRWNRREGEAFELATLRAENKRFGKYCVELEETIESIEDDLPMLHDEEGGELSIEERAQACSDAYEVKTERDDLRAQENGLRAARQSYADLLGVEVGDIHESIRDLRAQLAARQCEHCGSGWVVKDCSVCGAPTCCPNCCRINTLETELASRAAQIAELQGGNRQAQQFAVSLFISKLEEVARERGNESLMNATAQAENQAQRRIIYQYALNRSGFVFDANASIEREPSREEISKLIAIDAARNAEAKPNLVKCEKCGCLVSSTKGHTWTPCNAEAGEEETGSRTPSPYEHETTGPLQLKNETYKVSPDPQAAPEVE